MKRIASLLAAATVVAAAACDKAQLVAPTKSTISLSAPTRVLAAGDSTEVTATVVEQAGTPVPNGTTVRFSASLGRIDPAEAQTRNGAATTTFYATNTSGVARITAVSGAATAASDANVVEITIGAAAVNTITLRANPGGVGPNGGTVALIATVVAENGRALPNVVITFNTDQGTLSATTATTNENGEARTSLTTSRQAVVSATAGTKTSSNVTVGITSVSTVTLRAIPGSVGPSGGTVELLATVVGDVGQPLEDVLVTFSADQGSLASAGVRTNSSGEARTTLTTTQQTVVSATAGTKSSSNLTIAARVGPNVSLSCASGSSTCSAVQATGSNNTATVLFTITRASTSTVLRSATLDFGDSSSQSLGILTGGTATASHVYTGPTGTTARAYTATVQATDVNGDTASVSTVVTITPRQPLAVTFTATAAAAVSTMGQSVAFVATVTPTGDAGANLVSEYDWDFGDGFSQSASGANVTHVYRSNGVYTVRLTVRTTDGRSATVRLDVIVSGI
jgi:hypothetical protein